MGRLIARGSVWGAALAGAVVGVLAGGGAGAVVPIPTYPDCGKDEDLTTCPPDMTRADGSYRGNTWEFLSFIPPMVQDHIRPEEMALGSGNGFDVAYRRSTGRFDVTIAVLDAGIIWDDTWEIRNKLLFNRGEVQAPRNSAGATCANWDCDGNGVFNLQDYAADARIQPSLGLDAADGYLDPSDVLAAFSNNVDDDRNGYIDDVVGWDFLWDDNDPHATNYFDHGNGVMHDIAGEGGDRDSDLGYCPNCSLMPIRTGDSFIADADRLAQGILYATDQGADVIAMASGTINNTTTLHAAVKYAWDNGVVVVAAIGDENSYHHLYPGAADHLMAVHSIRYWPPTSWEQARSYLAFNGCNNWGSHLTVVAGTSACATGATAITAGAAGLILSYGKDLGMNLHPDEVRGLIQGTADDVYIRGSGGRTPWFPSEPGWDVMFGYGRINAGRALDTLAELGPPPQVHLTGPKWFTYVDASKVSYIDVTARMDSFSTVIYDWVLEWAPGGDVRDNDFLTLAEGTGNGLIDGAIYRWNLASIPRDRFDPTAPVDQILAEMGVLEKFDVVNTHTITLRLRATDQLGHSSEMRKSFFLHDDPDILPGFPIEVGASGESSPWLKDVDGDGVLDVLLGTASGDVHIFDGSGQELPGWPRVMPYTSYVDPARVGSHYYAPAYVGGGVARPREGVLAVVNADDLTGDGDMEVVVSTMDGKTWAYDHTGRTLAGFPRSRDPVGDADTDPKTWYDPGFLSSPYIGDLDGDGVKEIIQAGMDQKVYVWRPDGSTYPGFPVKLEYEGSDRNIKGRIVSTPEIADLDGDGIKDIVVGSNEYNPEVYVPGYAYAISGLGNNRVGGPNLPGWPTLVTGTVNGLVPFIGEGVPGTPIIADVDGDSKPEIALAGVAACPHLFQHNGARTVQYNCSGTFWEDAQVSEPGGIAFVINPIFADLDGDGGLEIIAALSGINYGLAMLASTWREYQDHMIGVWDARTGDMWAGWPVVVEDVGFFMRPAAADVDGDGNAEIIAGSGGYIVHAYDQNGEDVPGWPKFTGGWTVSALMAGDITGDGLTEVIAVTREGYLFAWGTSGVARQAQPPQREVRSPGASARR